MLPTSRRATPESPVAPPPAGPGADLSGLWDWRRNFFAVWTLLGAIGLLYVTGIALGLFATALLLFLVAAILAFVIHPLVSFLEEQVRLPRSMAATVIFLFLAILLVSVIVTAGVVLVNQVVDAVRQLPSFYWSTQERVQELVTEVGERLRALGVDVDVYAWQQWAFTSFSILPFPSADLATLGFSWLSSLTDTLVNVTVVLFIAFYLVVDSQRLANLTLRLAPERSRPYVLFVEKTLIQVVGGYLRGLMIMAGMMGIGVFFICLALGVRFSLLLAAVGFVFQMIPLIGPMFVGAALIAVALLDSVQLALFAFVAYFILQFVGTNVFGPRITGSAVGIHPIAAVLGLIAGANLFGLWGALLAVPVLGFITATATATYHAMNGTTPQESHPSTDPRRVVMSLTKPLERVLPVVRKDRQTRAQSARGKV
ncbi:MAG TPA: AI-2E family transporter [Chloroflexota bacterium]|nr:AI-2E family transporter [Chloroflexota bacterium]